MRGLEIIRSGPGYPLETYLGVLTIGRTPSRRPGARAYYGRRGLVRFISRAIQEEPRMGLLPSLLDDRLLKANRTCIHHHQKKRWGCSVWTSMGGNSIARARGAYSVPRENRVNVCKRCVVIVRVLVGDTNALHDDRQCPIRLNLQVSRLSRLFAICRNTRKCLSILSAHSEHLGGT